MAVDPEGDTTQISPERKFSQIPTGGVGRGSGGDHFAPSIGGEDHRRWPE
jgi:hypothetical protein